MQRRILNFTALNIIHKLTKLRAQSSRPKIDFSAHHRAKVIPQDIWQENKDPKYTDVEEIHGHWQFVERLFPKLRIPNPPETSSSTGWKAPSENVPDLPYFVQRTRNHLVPVYEEHITKKLIMCTKVRKILGDIWMFEHDLKKYLEEKLGEKVESNVNEIACTVNFKGHHSELITEWLYSKGF